MDEFLSIIVYVLQTPIHLAKFHILISTVHAKSAFVGLLYKRKSSVIVYIRKYTCNLLQNNVACISHTYYRVRVTTKSSVASVIFWLSAYICVI